MPDPATVQRLRAFATTIFTEISQLANRHGAVNLGQGFPNFDGPEFVKEAAIAAIRAGCGQYARMFGVPELNRTLAERFRRDTAVTVDPDAEITVTSGCTEAIAAAIIGLVEPGDEVVLIEPYYDSYRAVVAMAQATPRFVTLRPPHFRLPVEELRAAFSTKTRAILINTPHNPTGRVFDEQELRLVADLCRQHDVIAISDEVYERLVFEGRHVSLASLPGMYERTVTLSSLGKTYSLTGWKIGWAIAPPHLTAGVRAAHQFLTFATATPLQHAAVAALGTGADFDRQLVEFYRPKRDQLMEGLSRIGFSVFVPEGTYFIMADHSAFGHTDDVSFCRHLIEHVGVAAIPPSAFYHDPRDGAALVRFAFCKTDETLAEALRRMERLRGS